MMNKWFLLIFLLCACDCQQKTRASKDTIRKGTQDTSMSLIEDEMLAEMLEKTSMDYNAGTYSQNNRLLVNFRDTFDETNSVYKISLCTYINQEEGYYEILTTHHNLQKCVVGKLHRATIVDERSYRVNDKLMEIEGMEECFIGWVSDTTKQYGCFAIGHFTEKQKEDRRLGKDNVKIIAILPPKISQNRGFYGIYSRNEENEPLNIIWKGKALRKK